MMVISLKVMMSVKIFIWVLLEAFGREGLVWRISIIDSSIQNLKLSKFLKN